MTHSELVRAIKTLVAKADKAREKAEQFYIAAGLHLKTLKAQNPKTWEKVAKERCGLGRSRVYELIAIADGRKTVDEIRADTAKRTAETQARLKAAASATSGQP